MFNDNKISTDANYDTLVGENTTISGDIQFSGGLHVDGRVEGSIKASKPEDGLLVISERGVVNGEIDVPSVIIDGRLNGDLVARNRVELREHAQIEGNIRYGAIQMALGARINGKLESDKKAAQSSTGPANFEPKSDADKGNKKK